MLRKPLANNQIRAEKVRVIDATGKQLGIMPRKEALRLAMTSKLDLIQVTEKVEPPVCKIMDYGKYLYALSKKEKAAKQKMTGGIKGIRLGFNISLHDLEIKANQVEKFLKKGYKVKVELPLRGREKAFGEMAKEKISQFLEILEKLIPIKSERELKRESRGFTMIISRS